MPPRIRSPTPESDQVDELEDSPPPAARVQPPQPSKLKLTVTQPKQPLQSTSATKHDRDGDDDDDELSSLTSSSEQGEPASKRKQQRPSSSTTTSKRATAAASNKRKRPPTPSEDDDDDDEDMLQDDDEDEDDDDDGDEYSDKDELDEPDNDNDDDDDDAGDDDAAAQDDYAGARDYTRKKGRASKTTPPGKSKSTKSHAGHKNKKQKTTSKKSTVSSKDQGVKIKFKLSNDARQKASKKAKTDEWLVPDDDIDDELDGQDSDASTSSGTSTGSTGVRKTARQRAKEMGGEWTDYQSLSNAVMSKKPELTEAEKAFQKAEKARKRKSQKEAKLEDEASFSTHKTETINRLLKKQIGGGRGGSRTPKTQDEGDAASDAVSGAQHQVKTAGLNASKQRTIVTPIGPPTMIRYVSSIKSGQYKNIVMVPEVSGYVQSHWGAVPKVGGYDKIVQTLNQGTQPPYPPKQRPLPVTRRLNASS
ncbi:hypothetical protein OIV83_001994 [Microbotryomycetes sp. JL201]|nr:hypothetical protein OIV83_001994 [Microbotryomycetes sp. JL201]